MQGGVCVYGDVCLCLHMFVFSVCMSYCLSCVQLFHKQTTLTYRATSGQLAELVHAVKDWTVLPDID